MHIALYWFPGCSGLANTLFQMVFRSRSVYVYGCATAAVLAAALYLNSINGEFVFDDHEAIETNVDVRYKAPRLDIV